MKKKYTLFIILIILLNINACFRWGNIIEPTWYDISENFDSIDKNKMKQIENAQSEINIDERIYTFSCAVSRSQDYRWPITRWFSIDISEISVESLSLNSRYNIHFIQDFDIVEFFMINRTKKFYFSSKEIASSLVSSKSISFYLYIKKMNFRSKENEYKEDKDDFFAIKVKDKNNKEYFLRRKNEKEDEELRKKIDDLRKKIK